MFGHVNADLMFVNPFALILKPITKYSICFVGFITVISKP